MPDFRADWAKASADDKEQLFQRELAHLNATYDHLGLIGRRFKAAFKKTGCPEIKVLDDKQTPSFQGHHFSHGHQNKILYGGWCFDDREKLQDSSNHERTHAIQDSISAIAHAIPYNGNIFAVSSAEAGVAVGAHRQIILTPRDYMLLEELKERGSYAMQKILSELRSTDFDPIKQLGRNLEDYAAKVLESWDVAGSNPVISHLAHYRTKALHNYENMMINPKDRQPYDRDIIYVTFEAADIAALGNICGLEIFGHETADMSRWSATPLSEGHKNWVDNLTGTLGADKPVPFSVALKAVGLTREEFLTRSRAAPLCRPAVSPSPAPTPAALPNVAGLTLVPT